MILTDDQKNKYHQVRKEINTSKGINTSKEINNKDPKFKVGDHVRISKFKNIFAKGYMPNWSEEVFFIKKYHQVRKEIFKNVNDGNGELMLHEKIRLIDSNFPIEKIFKIHSITIVIKSLIEKDNKFYLELALNRCLFEPYEIKL